MVARITTTHPTPSCWDKKVKPLTLYERGSSALSASVHYARSSAGALSGYLWTQQPKSPYASIIPILR